MKKESTVLLSNCSWFRAKNIDQRCTSSKFWRKKLFDRKLIFFKEERYTYCLLKKQKRCMSSYYFLFNMSSCRKPKIQNDLPKITKIKWICYIFKQKSSTMFISSCCNNYLILIFKNREIKKIKSYDYNGIRTRNLWVWRYRTPAQ